jgi:hypothetical protein
MKIKNRGKKQTAIVLSIFTIAVLASSLMVGAASAHMLYIEANDKPDIPSVQAAEINLGHPNIPVELKAPRIEEAKLYGPGDTVKDLKPLKKANNSVVYFLLNQNGDHIIGAKRVGIYDPAWHNLTGIIPLQLIIDSAKIVIRAGGESNTEKSGMIPWAKVIGQEWEIVPLVDPLSLHVGDTFKAALLYKGSPTEGVYATAHATQDIHSPAKAQMGTTAEDGTFSIEVNKPGMWQVVAEYTVEESGTWNATYDIVRQDKMHYLKGDEIVYEQVRYRSTLTIYASP